MVKDSSENEVPDLLWGAAAIGRAIGRSPRQAFNLLENKVLPGRKVGNRWVASRRKLLNALVGEVEQ
jgi:hypothetical protein